jgi:hypothetical protein
MRQIGFFLAIPAGIYIFIAGFFQLVRNLVEFCLW